MRLWDKGSEVDGLILDFTVGDDHILDLRLVEHDCLASMAHARMLCQIGVLTQEETDRLIEGLTHIRELAERGEFAIDKTQEDGHTAIEAFLTEKYGEVGKKIHLGRSRNDQVLTALRLYEKKALTGIREGLLRLGEALAGAAERFGGVPIPGYTHMRKAMPASVGIWLGSFIEALEDDAALLETVFRLVDRSPLGTAAGFGVPVFELDREMTAEQLGFSGLISNPMYAQLSRGKIEMHVLSLLSGIMFTLQRLAADLLIFSMAEFGYIELPERLCTGSSIMPQKKNPDVLELIRGRYHVVCGEEFKVRTLASNLMSGYQRDLQLMKGPVFQAFDTTGECLKVMALVISEVKVNGDRCRDAMTDELYATEKAYRLVRDGMPFRDAYRRISSTLRPQKTEENK